MVNGSYLEAYKADGAGGIDRNNCAGTRSITGGARSVERLATRVWGADKYKLVALGGGSHGWNVYAAKTKSELKRDLETCSTEYAILAARLHDIEAKLTNQRARNDATAVVLREMANDLRRDAASLETFARGKLTLNQLPEAMERAHGRAGIVAQVLEAIADDLRKEST